MKKLHVKLIAIVVELVVLFSVVAVSSYAWMVLSGNPVAEGIQITIGGGNTILLAADVVEEVDGVTYHYPYVFRDTLNFSQHESYAYLNDLAELTPVSTADGVSWYLPAYYDLTDPEVADGSVQSGTLKYVDEFRVDELLAHANLTAEEGESAGKGSYYYVDFWVVSPGSDYTLRVSGGEDGGSFVIGLPRAEQTESGYALADTAAGAASSIRLGFLANPAQVTNNTMVYYQNSRTYNEQYTRLRGISAEKGLGLGELPDSRFTIYEPNGDLHPESAPAENGTYVVTTPVGSVDGAVGRVDIRDRLTVQLTNGWAQGQENTVGTQLEQRFQTALLEPSFRELTADEITQRFYETYLGNQVAPYVESADFIKSTGNLYNAAVGGAAAAHYLTEEYTAGATDDTYIIELEKNVPQRIRMFIWLEGEDVDCVAASAVSTLAAHIELAGSHVKE